MDNKEIVSTLIETALNQGDMSILDQLVATDAVDRDGFPGQPDGRAGFQHHFQVLRTAMPDFHVTFSLFADGETVVEEWTGGGTQSGPFPFAPATNNVLKFSGISIFEVKGGQVTSRRTYQDRMDLMQQLGLMPKQGG